MDEDNLERRSREKFIHIKSYWGQFHKYRKKVTFKYLPLIETLMANAITLSATVGVTVIKCQEFSSGNRSNEHAAEEVPSWLQSRFLKWQ